MGELSFEHVEAELTRLGIVIFHGHEFEARLGIDKSPNQPRTGDAIDVDAAARHPGLPDQFD